MALSLDRSLTSSPADHLADHLALHRAFNMVRGPFTLAHDAPGIDSGVVLWTPNVGDIITGVWVEFAEAFDAVGEEIGLGIAGTTDADLALRFPVTVAPPALTPTFPRGRGLGIPLLGSEVVRVLTTDPIRARTVIGGNTAGSLTLRVLTIPAVQLA